MVRTAKGALHLLLVQESLDGLGKASQSRLRPRIANLEGRNFIEALDRE